MQRRAALERRVDAAAINLPRLLRRVCACVYVDRGGAINCPLRLKLNRIDICMPSRAASSGRRLPAGAQRREQVADRVESRGPAWCSSGAAAFDRQPQVLSDPYCASGTQGLRSNTLHNVGMQGWRSITLHGAIAPWRISARRFDLRIEAAAQAQHGDRAASRMHALIIAI